MSSFADDDGPPALESHRGILRIPNVYASVSALTEPITTTTQPEPIEIAHPSVASVDHFQINDITSRKPHSRRAPKFAESKIYINNPAPSSLLVDSKHALHLSDHEGRTYWNATHRFNNVNSEWVIDYMNSDRYEQTDCILLAKCKPRDSDFTTFPDVGCHTFTSTVGPPSSTGETLIGRTRTLIADIVHTSQYARGSRARKTCYIVIRNGFNYVVNDDDDDD